MTNTKVTLKKIYADIVIWFIVMYVFDETYKKLKKQSPELQENEKRLYNLIGGVLILFLFVFWIIIFI